MLKGHKSFRSIIIASLLIVVTAISASASWLEYVSPISYLGFVSEAFSSKANANPSATPNPSQDLAATETLPEPEIKKIDVAMPDVETKDVPNNDVVNVSSYPFTATTGALLEDMTTGSTSIMGGGADDSATGLVPIGFDFWFDGVRYGQFSASSNGLLQLGTAATTSGSNALNGAGVKVAAYWDDQCTAQNGRIQYKVVGSAPNRKLAVEWTNMVQYNSGCTTTPSGTYQVWLYESTGVVELVYGPVTASIRDGFSTGVASAASSFASVTSSGTPAVSYATENATQTNAIVGGTKFTFTPPVPTGPSSLFFSGVSSTGMTLNWTDGPDEAAYGIYRSDDGGTTYNLITTLAAGTTGYIATGLGNNHTYFWRVFGLSAGHVGTPAAASQATNAGTLGGTISVGPTGTYPTLTAAFTAITSSGLSSSVILELQSTYTSGGETFPLAVPVNASPTNTITVRPETGATALSITGSNTVSIVDLNGAKYVTFDGRPGGAGTAKQLTISNTSTATGGAAVRFTNEASSNAFRYLILRALYPSLTSGVVNLLSTSGTYGNDNNTIDNNDIDGGAGATASPTLVAQNGIYSAGNTATYFSYNSGNVISNNNVFNSFVSGGGTSQIFLGVGTTENTITGNSIYQTATRTATSGSQHNGIRIDTAGSGFVVSSNFIGGSTTGAGGTPWTLTGAVTSRPVGIYVNAGLSVPTSIQGNTIANFSTTTSSGAATTNGTFSAIWNAGGNVNIGTTTGNTIGSATGTGNITATSSTTGGIANLISHSAGTGSIVDIRNNTVGAVTVLGSTTSIGHGYNGILVSGGTPTIMSNTIGNATANNMNASTVVTGSAVQSCMGIQTTSGVTSATTISSNTVQNLNQAGTSTSSLLRGISSGGTGITTISSNLVNSLTAANGNTTLAGGATGVMGILQTGTAPLGATVTLNTVNTISATNTGAVQTNALGIGYSNPTAGTITRNRIYDIRNASTGTTATTPPTASGIMVRTGVTSMTVANNFISLGTSQTTNTEFIGIWNSFSGTSLIAHYNSVHIAGTASSGALPSFAFLRGDNSGSAVTTAMDIKNNILNNTRTGGTGKHYAIANQSTTPSVTGWPANASNFNGLNSASASTVGLWGSIDQTFAAWKTASSSDAGSLSGVPTTFVDAANGDLHLNFGLTPTQYESGGVAVATTIDYDNQTRPGPAGSVNGGATAPDIGADEFDGVPQDLTGPVITYTGLTNTTSSLNRTLAITVTDVSGVPTSGVGRPAIYFRKNAGSYFSTTCAHVSGSNYDCTIDNSLFGGVLAGDLIEYYVAAQDNAGTPNVSVNPSAGASGFTANPPAASTPPTTPSGYTIIPTISGTKTVGAGGDYTTLTAAIAAINGAEVSGPVVLSLTDATYTTPAETFPLVLNANSGSSATNTITIVPATGNVATITGSSANCILTLNGADYVTVDGSNSGGSDRSLTISNSNTAATTASVCLVSNGTALGATNNTIQNTNIAAGTNQATGINLSFGIYSGGSGTMSITNDGVDNDSNAFTNNFVTSARYGIWVRGGASNPNDSVSITNNLVGPAAFGPTEIGRNGILIQHQNLATISQNEVRFVGGNFANRSTFGKAIGIAIGSETGPTPTTTVVTNSTITRNLVHDIVDEQTGSAIGILVGNSAVAASSNTISNNSVHSVRANGTSGDQTNGITIAGGNGDRVVFNSVSLSGDIDPSGTTTATQSAIGIRIVSTSVVNLTLANNASAVNVTSNTGTLKHYAVVVPSTTFNWGTGSSNYNDWFPNTASAQSVLGGTGTATPFTDVTNIVNWRLVTTTPTMDANGIDNDPLFNSATNLQPQAGSPLLLAGTPIAGITTDILGVTRNVTTPTIGAYETVADVAGPSITYTSLPNTTSLLDTAITATITDPSGVPTSGTLRPRVYFKRSTDASYVSRVCTFSSPTYNCGLLYAALPGAPVAGDTIQYFIIAQDNLGNISSNPSGVVATNVNTVTTPPTPNSYNILLLINSYPYFQNFESGAGGYTSGIVGGSVNDWVLGTPAKTQLSAAYSGTNAWVTKTTGDYSNSHNAAVYSPIFDFTTILSSATISFRQNFDIDFDPDYDSMVFEVSTDGGTVWSRVDSNVGSGGTFDTADSTGWYNLSGTLGPITGPEWTDSSTGYASHASGWILSTTKAGALAGQADVRFRWRFASDSSVVDEGFAIDDIAVTPAVVAAGSLQLSSATYGGNENTILNANVNRVLGSSGTVTVDYTLTDSGGTPATGGAACGGSVDYVNTGGTLTFVDSDVLETINITLCADAVVDPSETFTITLSNFTGGASPGSPTVAVATITNVLPPLAGSYNVPGDFPSLTNPGGIFERINDSGTTGAVTINITADLTAETGTVALNAIASGFGVTVQPSGAARLIEGSNTTGLINLNGADNVTFTGAPFGSTGLTIRNTSATTGSVFRFLNDASTNGIVSCLIEQNNTASTAVLFSTGTTTGNDDNQVTGSTIRGTSSTVMPFNSIESVGTSAAISNGNLNITNNTITDFGQTGVFLGTGTNAATVSGNDVSQTTSRTGVIYGLYMDGTTGAQVVSGNRIHGLTSNSASTTGGILIGNSNASISENRIYNIQTTATATGGIAGIFFVGISGGTPSVTLANNFVSIAPTITSSQLIIGIFDYGYSGNIFTADHNTVYIGGTGSGSASTWALLRGDFAPTTFTARNNIAFNNRTGGSGNHFAGGDQSAGTGTFVSNGNFFAGTGATPANFMDFGSSSSGTPVSFATYQAGPPARDAASTGNVASSYVESNIFVNATAGDLHLKSTAGVDIISAGIALGSVTTDIDLDPRPATAPDKGADEIVQAVAGSVAGGAYYNAIFAEGDSLAGNVSVSNTAYLTGESNTGGNTLSLGCNAAFSGAGGGNYVVGSVAKEFCATQTFTFPVGTVSDAAVLGTPPEYTPMTAVINGNTFPSSLTVSVVDDHMLGLDPSQAVSRYWSVTETGNLNVDMTFNYLDGDVNGSEANYKVFRKVGGGFPSQVTPFSLNNALNTATVTGVENFSFWGIGGFSPSSSTGNIGGRVVTASGQGLRGAAVVVTGNSLPSPRIVRTGSLGYFSVEGLDTGQTYIVTVVSKRFTFSQPSRVVTLTDNINDVDFIADPQQ